jgi:probable HAF family extracellular repeat protein
MRFHETSMKRQSTFDVGQCSLWAFEVEVPLDDAVDQQARSMIAQRSAMAKIQEKLVALALGLLLGVPGPARADVNNFDFTTIDVPDSTSTAANGNSTHEIAGQFDDVGGNTHGFVLRGGVGGLYTTVDKPGASLTIINGISTNGQLAGTYQDPPPGSGFHAYFWSKGIFTTLDPPGSIRSQGGFLNAQGQVVGTYRTQIVGTNEQRRHGFIWSKGVFTTFNVPNDHPILGTVAFGINDPGQIVGDYVDTDGTRHGFLLSGGVYTTLDPPGSSFTVAEGINNAGVIVGTYIDADGQHGFVFSRNVYTRIDVPNSTGTAVLSINARGEIVGFYGTSDDPEAPTHGFVGTPAR